MKKEEEALIYVILTVKERLKDVLKYTDKGYFVYFDKKEGRWIHGSEWKNLANVVIQSCLNELLEDEPFLDKLGSVLERDSREWLSTQIILRGITGKIRRWYKRETDVQIEESELPGLQHVQWRRRVRSGNAT